MEILVMLLSGYNAFLLWVKLIFYLTCHLETQNVASTLPDFQGIKRCVKYLAGHLHKPIFYPSTY